jgi:hypothetical protein
MSLIRLGGTSVSAARRRAVMPIGRRELPSIRIGYLPDDREVPSDA